MATGLIALLDDIAALAKTAAASLDDAAAQATKAGSKAAGIVIDDAAVTPRYVVGFTAERELPVIGKIALGSLRNKFFWILPAALVLSSFAPWLLTPLLMLGGAYLCLEGFHKVHEILQPHAHHPGPETGDAPVETEAGKIASAIRTDFILSAEIMTIALANVANSPLWIRTVALAIVGLGMTVLVYGVVALIVKADDFGAHLARSSGAPARALGRAIVNGMPPFLAALSFVGMLAMLWVGGGILVHGLHELGVHGPEEAIKHLTAGFGPVLGWLATASIYAVIGLAAGAAVNPPAAALSKLHPSAG